MAIIAFASFKGGTAKTSSTLHFGALLAKEHGKRVLLIDFDAQANLTAGLGLDPDQHESLAPVLQGQKTIQEVTIPLTENLHLIPADSWLERVELTGPLAHDRYAHEKLRSLLTPLNYDFILIEAPPSLSWLTESAFIAANHTVICATAEFYSVKGLERLSQFIAAINERHPLDVLGIVLSFWNDRGKNNDDFLALIDRIFPDKCFQGRVRRDVKVQEAAIRGVPVFQLASKTRASQDYREVVSELLSRLEEPFRDQAQVASL